MNLEGKRVFVSGGAGVIGRSLVAMLVNEGAQVFVGDLKRRPTDFPININYRKGDLNTLTANEFKSLKPHLFFHLAATFERVEESDTFWDENYQHNIKLSHHLLSLCKEQHLPEAIIFASSYLIYDPRLYLKTKGNRSSMVLKESDPIRPRNLTGGAKWLCEQELQFMNTFYGDRCRIAAARIFRSYGCGSKDVISRWIRSLLKEELIEVYGASGRFDFIGAKEVAEGLLRMAKNESFRGVYNLGRGHSRSIREVLNVLRTHFPNMLIAENKEPSEALVETSEADMRLFSNALGWSPSLDLEDVVPEIIDFERARGAEESEPLLALGNVLITSISKKVALIQSMRRASAKLSSDIKIIGGDSEEDCLGRYFVDTFWKMPKLSELPLETLIAYCRGQEIRFIIPTRDGELLYFAQNKQRLQEAGITVMVSSESVVKTCLDKLHFYKVLNAEGYPVIDTFDAIKKEQTTIASWVVKECSGSGARGMGIDVNTESAIGHAAGLENPIFQPYIKGKEFSADIYLTAGGEVKGVVLRWREKVVNGESQITCTFKDRRIEGMIASAAQFLGIRGHAVLQGIMDESGKIHLIEANCRFGGASSLSEAVGLESFYWFLLESMGESLADYPFVEMADKRLVRASQDLVLGIQ